MAYYFLAPSLPELAIGVEPEIRFEDLVFSFKVSLSQDDWKSVRMVRGLIDIENLRKLFLEEPLDVRGNFNEKELDEALLSHGDLPDFIYDFLQKYEGCESRLAHFASLIAQYFQYAIQTQEGFLQEYFIFEHHLRLILSALRCKMTARDIVGELQFENSQDPFVAQILAQKDAPDYSPPVEFQELKEILEGNWGNPLKLHKKVEEFRFKKVSEITQDRLFSIDAILSYMVRLLIVEDWMSLNEAVGTDRLRSFLEQELRK